MLQEAVISLPTIYRQVFQLRMSRNSASRKPRKRSASVSRLLKCGFIGHA